MSSVLTKILVSKVVSLPFDKQKSTDLKQIFDWITNPHPVPVITYGAMVAYDIYDYFKGDIQTITTKDSEGNLVTKEYRVTTFDSVKCIANTIPVVAAIELPILDKIFGSEPLSDVLLPAFLCGSIVLETVADIFNWHPITTIAHEVNSDDFMLITN